MKIEKLEELIVELLPSGDPRAKRIQAALRETPEKEERLIGLKELSERLGYHPTWLRRIQVPQKCGVRIAGGIRYKESCALSYMQSDACRLVVADIRERKKNTKNAALRNSTLTHNDKGVKHG